jgi:hypothetical protein
MYTLQGKTRPTRHVRFPRQSTYARCMLPAVVPVRDNLSRVTDRVGRILLLPRKSAPDSTSQPGWVAHGTRLSFSPKTAIEAVDLNQAPVDGRLLGLPGPYHWHAIGTFNTCSRVPTPQSLTDTGGGYYIENLGIGTTLSPSFPSESFTDPPKWLRLISIFIQH